ncbi:MAG: glyoxalase/bleomycin resistance/dioxygenase family protein [Curvibacter sp. PD_MW3]|nr:MAG: glyoxalase/bleomycin resistance/dioxygenase family protein [Curvibacter sp. PD_MW3]
MKRFHVHVHVDDIAKSIAFYSKLFAAEPARIESDYAKWMLEDPRVNFAISTRGTTPGVDHLGFQVDDSSELDELKGRAQAADMTLLDEGATTCCYARSEKHWVTDPQGIAWEHFHTLGNIPMFNESSKATASGECCSPTDTAASAQTACCGPATALKPVNQAASACCAPAVAATAPTAKAACCGPNTSKSSCC